MNDIEFLPTEGTVRIGECLRGRNGTETYLASKVGLVQETDQIQSSRTDCCAHTNDHRMTFEVDHEMTVGIQPSCTVIQMSRNSLRSMGLFDEVKQSSKEGTHGIIVGESQCLRRVDGRGGSDIVCRRAGGRGGDVVLCFGGRGGSRIVIRYLRRDGQGGGDIVCLCFGGWRGTKPAEAWIWLVWLV